jgi:hypothetical protein
VMNDQRNFRLQCDSRQRVAQAQCPRRRTYRTWLSYLALTSQLKSLPCEVFEVFNNNIGIGEGVVYDF